MIKRSHVLAALLCLSSFFAAQAQVGFMMPTHTGVTPGQVLDIPIRVINFDTVISAQFVIHWDPSVLKFVGLLQPTDPLGIVDSICFNFQEASTDGNIRFRWLSTASPKTLADSTDIFLLQMKAIGTNGTSTAITFTELVPITYFEVAKLPGPQFFTLSTALISNGLISIGTSGTSSPAAAPMALRAIPNPFTDGLNLSFDLPESGDTQLFVTDVAGKICYQEKKYRERGINGTVIANGVFPAKGMYFVHIANGGYSAVQPIVYQ